MKILFVLFGVIALLIAGVFLECFLLKICWNYISNTFTIMPKINIMTAFSMTILNGMFWAPFVMSVKSGGKK